MMSIVSIDRLFQLLDDRFFVSIAHTLSSASPIDNKDRSSLSDVPERASERAWCDSLPYTKKKGRAVAFFFSVLISGEVLK